MTRRQILSLLVGFGIIAGAYNITHAANEHALQSMPVKPEPTSQAVFLPPVPEEARAESAVIETIHAKYPLENAPARMCGDWYVTPGVPWTCFVDLPDNKTTFCLKQNGSSFTVMSPETMPREDALKFAKNALSGCH